MNKELSEHNFKVSDEDALAQLKILMEFTSPGKLRKSIQKCFFSFLSHQADCGQDENFKQIINDHQHLQEFLERLDSE